MDAPRTLRAAVAAVALLSIACAVRPVESGPTPPAAVSSSGERIRVLEVHPGVTATIVAPAHLDGQRRVDLVLYALPNGNSTAETMGRAGADSAHWRFDIQHIGAQTRALRAMGMPQAVVVYLEAEGRSWPAWRARLGDARADARVVEIVDRIRAAVGDPPRLAVTLAGHSGGGSFMFGLLDGRDSLPSWLERIAFLDADYNYRTRHAAKLVTWLRGDPRRTLVVLAYDDRQITLGGRKVVSDSGGTWRATARMMDDLRGSFSFVADTLGEFLRYRAPQVEVLLHPNPENRILHTAMIGEMNGFMHALLVRRPDYDGGAPLLRRGRAYERWLEGEVTLPAAAPPDIPARDPHATGGRAFVLSLAALSRDERERAIRRELLAGNVPSFLRSLRPVTVRDGLGHVVVYEVMPDYLAIGSDDDFVRMPMQPYTAQAFADAFGFVLPTRRMVNDIWASATLRLDPWPLTQEREAPATFLEHHRLIGRQLVGAPRGPFVAGIKKDVVVTNLLRERPGRVALYGWHDPAGVPIQPLYTGHVDWYVDYSHGIRLVRRAMLIDGARRPFERIVGDSVLAALLSDEGPMASPRYER